MKLNSRSLLIALIVWIPIVGILFAFIPEKKIASVIAGSGFMILPILVLVSEFKKVQKNKTLIFITSIFFFLSAAPIFLLRVLNWHEEFRDLSLLGIPADFLHRASNLVYLLMLVTLGIAAYHERKIKPYQK